MSVSSDLIELEHSAWRALSASGNAAREFFTEVLAENVLMLLPGGLVIDDRAQVIDSMGGAPWTSFELADERVLPLTEASAVVSYRATARRGDDDYAALFNSTYIRVGESWRMALHQQTPI